MKLIVKCVLGREADGMKELMIHNPVATLSNVRAAIAINFRLPVHGFRMVHSTADLSCEKTLLRDSGICDGDLITVAAKRDREEETNSQDENGQQQQQPERGNILKARHLQTSSSPTVTTAPAGTSVAAECPETSKENFLDNPGLGDDSVDEDDDSVDDDDEMQEGSTELLCHLLATVPNLLEMRQQFLANPAEIMQQIRERDPRLLELIMANYQEFLDLVNNEDLVETLQREQEAAQEALFDEEGEFDEEEEGEFDEEVEATINSAMARFLATAGGDDNDDDSDDDNNNDHGGSGETRRYLERVPTEEEEAKIEQLMQLGFTRDQCKVAFFKSRRSLERAANLLFEDPPQL